MEIERRECARSLSTFIKKAWHVLEPGQPYDHGWHIDAMSEHLQAITDGEISRLLINVPPGMMKSVILNIMWPSWEWGPKRMTYLRFLGTSHNINLAVRDSTKMRRLVQSKWFQDRWPTPLMSDQNSKTKFETDTSGFREAMAFTSLTGSRGDRVLIDDPLSVDDASSDQIRESVNETFREAVPSRLNNPKRSAIVVIMQRLHERDVSGLILSEKLGYEHLRLPMEFEPEDRCITSIGFIDPRTEEGELLFPERFPRDVVERDKKVMTEYAVAGQYQQRPVPRGGGLFKREWFEGKVLKGAPADVKWVRHWDLAATKKTSAARTAGVKIGRTFDGRYIVGDVIKFQEEGHRVREIIKATAERDGFETEISLPQDPGQAGKVQASDMVSMLSGYKVKAEPETGDKYSRAEPFSAQCGAGNVYLIEAPWNTSYLDELCMFPNGTFKDQVDASSGAFGQLVRNNGFNPDIWTKAYGQ